MRRHLSFAIVALVVASSARARAFERQHHLGVGGGMSLLKIDDKSTLDVGAGLGLHYAYGLTDQFNLMAEGTSSIVAIGETGTATTPKTRPAGVDTLAVGVSYVLDVLRWVPYFGVLASGTAMSGGTLPKGIFLGGAQIALGLDYQISRNLAVGGAIRQHIFLTNASTYPSFTQVFARVEYVWGW